MDSAEQEQAVKELDERVERLRAYYDQYFMGIERTEPLDRRKDVDKRILLLRREQIRNTGLRFKSQQIIQRYNSFAQYWQRILREMENGTYKRDLAKAAKRFGTEGLSAAAKKNLGQKEVDRIEQQLAQQAEQQAARRPGRAADEEEVEPEPEELDSSWIEEEAEEVEEEDTSPFRRAANGTLEAVPKAAPAAAPVPPPRPSLTSTPQAPRAPQAPQPALAAQAGQAPQAAPAPRAPLSSQPLGAPRAPLSSQPAPQPAAASAPQPAAAAASAPQPAVAQRPAAIAQSTRRAAPGQAAPVALDDDDDLFAGLDMRGGGPRLAPAMVRDGEAPSSGNAIPARTAQTSSSGLVPGARPSATNPPLSSPRPSGTAVPPPASGPASGPARPSQPSVPAAPGAAASGAVRPPQPSVTGVPGATPSGAVRPPQPSVPGAPASGPVRPPQPSVTGVPGATPSGPVRPPQPSVPLAASSGAQGEVPASRPTGPVRPVANPVARPQPRPSPGPSAEELNDGKIREIYGRYVDAKRKCNESTAAITFDNLAKSLRDSVPKLREKHGGRVVDFEVVIKDGRAVLKPVVKT